MDDPYELLLKRRSIRSFKDEEIPEGTMQKVLTAGRYAPSALGLQNRFFSVVQSRSLMKKIIAVAEKNGAAYISGHVPFYNAPDVIVVSAPEDFRYNREDAACVIENLMLAACALGLGSCYLCSVLPGLRDPEIMKELKLPHGYVPCGCACVGYPAVPVPAPKSRRKDDTVFLR